MTAGAQDALFEIGTVTGKPWLTAGEYQQQGLAAAEAGTDEWWRSCCDAAIAYLDSLGFPFDAYTLAELGVPEPSSPNHWGARLAASAKAGLIVRVGYRPSRRPKTARSAVAVWQGAEHAVGEDG